jgi:hypothetical protein
VDQESGGDEGRERERRRCPSSAGVKSNGGAEFRNLRAEGTV